MNSDIINHIYEAISIFFIKQLLIKIRGIKIFSNKMNLRLKISFYKWVIVLKQKTKNIYYHLFPIQLNRLF